MADHGLPADHEASSAEDKARRAAGMPDELALAEYTQAELDAARILPEIEGAADNDMGAADDGAGMPDLPPLPEDEGAADDGAGMPDEPPMPEDTGATGDSDADEAAHEAATMPDEPPLPEDEGAADDGAGMPDEPPLPEDTGATGDSD